MPYKKYCVYYKHKVYIKNGQEERLCHLLSLLLTFTLLELQLGLSDEITAVIKHCNMKSRLTALLIESEI